MQLAETTLVDEARRLKPKELRTVGKRILEMVAPELFEETEAKRLAEEEDRAWRRTSLRFQPTGDGTTKAFLRLPDASAIRLRTYLEAYTAPRNRTGEPGEASQIPGDRKGQAFCALLEHLDPARLPQHGGDATTVMVTIPLDALATGLGHGELLDGTHLSPGEARRLACTAKILPAVLGGHSEVLDLGRADRLFRPAQRKAIRLRDRRCRAKDCVVRAEWTEVHHLHPWRDGGSTDLANCISLCFYHHRRADHPYYEASYNPTTRELEITRRRRR